MDARRGLRPPGRRLPRHRSACGRHGRGRPPPEEESIRHLALRIACSLCLALGAASAQAAAPAFPRAAGHGALASGGRGGRVIEVTNLNDSGPGSLREALLATGPRIVVFRVGGTLRLDSAIVMRSAQSDVTVAGQTAPGGGILIRSNAASPDTLIRLYGASNVVLRYLRLRNGAGSTSDGFDNIAIRYGHDIMLDHLSGSWSTDENISAWNDSSNPCERITVQQSLLAEGIDGHSTGLHISGDADYTVDPPVEDWKTVRKISVHRNLFHTNAYRNPRVNVPGAEVVNNLVYNWRSRVLESKYGAIVDWVNNYLKEGPQRLGSDADYVVTTLMMYQDRDDPPDGPVLPLAPSIYSSGTLIAPRLKLDPATDDWPFWTIMGIDPPQGLPSAWRRSQRQAPAPVPVPVVATGRVPDEVLGDVGANARLDCRGSWVSNPDAVDRRLVAEVRNGTGGTRPPSLSAIVYPTIDPGTACADADHDGMPDEWETRMGLRPNDPADGPADADQDGYTNLEEYLNGPPPGTLAPPPPPVLIPTQAG